MVKHNNIIPNIHCHKKYLQSSRGPLKVRLNLNQATRKKARRLARAKKAAAIAPRPLQMLRPVVHCQTQRYSAKQRLGRGFTLAEIKGAGLNPSYARSIGIAVDHRRSNKCQESLDRNVARLEEYKKNLVVLKKKDDAAPTEGIVSRGNIMPVVKPAHEVVVEAVTDEMKEFKAFTTMRLARQESKVKGYRVAVENRKKKD
ncbi:60S ribosomal protein L13-1 [Seminavis robusta]|uniref:60S ribosomal protein L13 n=1 Tax=Seminavis robusta TaxID=568900 RepID=A0A9N8DQX6_9STRA|nr:60S ribosomal protein L13-1 [Seminavis robusta]|eukprot:Sro307_g113390.1 60S ribosomal protein L13-1 (201) ;mRNA; f:57590-58192